MFNVFKVLLVGRGGGDPAGSLREGGCPSDAVVAGSPPEEAGGETLKKLKIEGRTFFKIVKDLPSAEGPGVTI